MKRGSRGSCREQWEKMRYGKIKYFDIANGEGIRTSLFVSGCNRHCAGCFSPETWSFGFGDVFTKETEDDIIASLEPSFINGLSVLGGEPFESSGELLRLVCRARETHPQKSIWLFTGYPWDELKRKTENDSEAAALLECVDVLKCGPFLEAQAGVGLLFKGSRNQELVDMKKTLASGKKVLWEPKKVKCVLNDVEV